MASLHLPEDSERSLDIISIRVGAPTIPSARNWREQLGRFKHDSGTDSGETTSEVGHVLLTCVENGGRSGDIVRVQPGVEDLPKRGEVEHIVLACVGERKGCWDKSSIIRTAPNIGGHVALGHMRLRWKLEMESQLRHHHEGLKSRKRVSEETAGA
jgi:hypothetical protein